MLWACLAAAALGLAIGLRSRINLLLAAAFLTSAATIVFAIWEGWTFVGALAAVFLLLAIEQVFYLVGLFVSMRR